MIAITREISAAIDRCELTHLDRVPIDVATARAQHADYERCLAGLGCAIERLPASDTMPDSVFIEDTAIVLPELAVIARPGAASRRAETAAVAGALGRHRTLRFIEPPATLDGGDVLVAGRQVFAGASARTSAAGIAQLRAILEPYGYRVVTAPVTGCLHLKSAVTAIDERTLLMNRGWTDAAAFGGFDIVDVDPQEPFAANALWLDGVVVHAAEFPCTRRRLEARGFTVRTVPASELAKAEGGVTCCSLIVR